MNVLIDTNVLLDVLTVREPFYKNSAIVWSMVEEGLIKGYISAISVNNIYYIAKKLKGIDEAEEIVDKVINDFKIVSLNHEILKLSRTISKKDFEDIIQYFSALKSGCDCIITRNKKDFPSDKMSIMEPSEFIQKHIK
jgi:predicted nucleic acid-binding protein